ncbi:energy-coupling factor ABC transporter substrate-binding protein [Pararhodospirillum photometricum]|uniref:Cobalt transport protein CbiN n=1 Tax=Pararhodospirillum photometricum DSM 122 TaxID=1150469 RepID=H6SQX0_PARPM|nr:energy-coupling factor ABC transporter substrate-binding protein [Pararhodospirillum photometricum]CCG07435.1 Putative uncharacterized protein [Pararhodospirillum photometricum DSM 122]
MTFLRDNRIIFALVVGILLLPLLMPSLKDAEFSGADSQAEGVITALAPDYQPWFESLWEPPSGEIESLLFALQAGLGAGILGYVLGFHRGRAGKDHTTGRDD